METAKYPIAPRDTLSHEANRETTAQVAPAPRPGLWVRLSVARGNLVQMAGLVLAAGFLRGATAQRPPAVLRVGSLALAWSLTYVCSHAIAHWAAGRVVGIRFRGYGIRGTDHPEIYPPVLRAVMLRMPFFSVLTEKESMRQAGATAKAIMFSAGETSTSASTLLATGYAWARGVPGGAQAFLITACWNLVATITTARTPRGDYAKALRALRAGRQGA